MKTSKQFEPVAFGSVKLFSFVYSGTSNVRSTEIFPQYLASLTVRTHYRGGIYPSLEDYLKTARGPILTPALFG
jgi:hypothetical protein